MLVHIYLKVAVGWGSQRLDWCAKAVLPTVSLRGPVSGSKFGPYFGTCLIGVIRKIKLQPVQMGQILEHKFGPEAGTKSGAQNQFFPSTGDQKPCSSSLPGRFVLALGRLLATAGPEGGQGAFVHQFG